MPTDSNQHQLSISVPSESPTPGTPTGSATLRMVRRRRAALLGEIHLLEQALAAPARDPGWRPRVRSSLGGLRCAFAEHMVSTEGPDGLYAELLDHAPRLARGVHVLIREHAAVVDTMSALQRRVDLPEIGVTELRNWATDLLRELSRHRQRGADLVYEAYQTDIGGET
ncbi:hypothetical protein V1634_23015 [Plantactinospora veratri]|uniref:Hemerythrin-like domain-containing protein n=1 Tax=Plantactinospora veratri TaxID=1436122 RepID=A0ABU7SIC6_9ACTN